MDVKAGFPMLIRFIDGSLAIIDEPIEDNRYDIVQKNIQFNACGPDTIIGSKVIFTNHNGYDGDRNQAREMGLEPLKEYIVSNVVVHSYSTSLYLEGFKVGFNSVMFCKP